MASGFLSCLLLVSALFGYATYKPVFGWVLFTPGEMDSLQTQIMRLIAAYQKCMGT